MTNGDGDPSNYNLAAGDRPEILGDQTIWWIMNDRGNDHEWYGTLPLGIEVRSLAFAFSGFEWGFVKNTTFYKYVIRNGNERPIEQAYTGFYMYPEIGYCCDDYAGSDSSLALAFYYNGDEDDDWAYGDTPPALGITLLKGPKKEIPGPGSCSARSGNELGLVGHITGKGSAEPQGASGLYDTMRSRWWRTGKQMMIGDNEWPTEFSEIPTNWIFPGDPVTDEFWSARNIDGLGTAKQPSDPRGYVSSGPFCLDPGEETEIVFAIVWSRGKDHLDSVRKLRHETRVIQSLRDDILTPLALVIEPEPRYDLRALHNYPEPFEESTTISYSIPRSMNVRLTVHDALGRELQILVDKWQEAGDYLVPFQAENFPTGIYLARLQIDHLAATLKMVHVR